MTDVIITDRRKILLIKIETTSGTDSVPVAATNGVLMSNITFTPESDRIEREVDRAYFGAFLFITANVRGILEFDVELIGAASVGTAAAIGPVLRAAGHAQTLNAAVSTIYNPISSAFETVTAYFEIVDPNNLTNVQRFALLGCQGSIEITQEIGGFTKARCRLLGTYVAPASATLTAPTLTAFRDPIAITTASWTFTLDGFALNARSFKLTQGAEQKFFEGSERNSTLTTDRRSSGEITAFDPGSAKALYTLATANTAVALSSVVTAAAGSITTIAAPKVQLQMPRIVSIDGAQGVSVAFVAAPNTGNDEYTITFT